MCPAENRIDATRPDSPPLAGPGPLTVGVRTLALTDPGRVDLAASRQHVVRGPRSLTVELWYPAATGTVPGGRYRTLIRDGETEVTLHGRAARDAAPAEGRWPVVLISHGYPGNRFLMSHLAETLASRGYLVASADHPQSTYDDQGSFGATLLHRPLDQRFLLQQLVGMPQALPRAAIVGYSMGGYGALVTAGAGLAPEVMQNEMAPPFDLLARHLEGSAPAAPEELGAVVAIGPFGNSHGLWRDSALERLAALPLLVIAGDRDDTSGYDGMRGIAEAGRGTLLTFHHAGHNAAAPIPAPAESHAVSARLGWAPFLHYADAVWDSVRMNAVAQHVVAAFLNRHLKEDAAMEVYLDPARGLGTEAGFAEGRDAGLRLERWR
ncbi:MAG: dienelactone hydrolase [Rhodobacteraceae bacterium]|nr:dienelactone hydrolase [Paracoccaceae bacterium]